MTTFASPLPPSHLHSSTTISPSTALHHLTTFLETADIDAGYRPDSTLSERGPISTSTPGNPNLTLHHLSRISEGLQGRNLGSDDLESIFPTQTETETETHPTKKRKVSSSPFVPETPQPLQRKTPHESSSQPAAAEEDQSQAVATQDQEWQDKTNYDQAQTEDEGGGGSDPAANVPQPKNQRQAEAMMRISTHDKEEEDDDIVMGESRPVTKKRVKGKGKALEQGRGGADEVEVDETRSTRVIDKEERKRLKKERAARTKSTAMTKTGGAAAS